MKTTNPEQSKKYNRRLRALLTKKQPGKDIALLEKIIKYAEIGLAPTKTVVEREFDEETGKHVNVEVEKETPLDERKFATKTILDLLPFALSKETAPLVQINNNTQNNRIEGPIPIQKLVDYMDSREKKIEALEARDRTRQLKSLEGSKKVSSKLPANSPLNPQ